MDRPTEALERMRVCTTTGHATLLLEDYARVLEWVAHLESCRQELREAIDFDEEYGEGAAYAEMVEAMPLYREDAREARAEAQALRGRVSALETKLEDALGTVAWLNKHLEVEAARGSEKPTNERTDDV